VTDFDESATEVHGVDNNMRQEFLGPKADTTWNLRRLGEAMKHSVHHNADIRERGRPLGLFRDIRPDVETLGDLVHPTRLPKRCADNAPPE